MILDILLLVMRAVVSPPATALNFYYAVVPMKTSEDITVALIRKATYDNYTKFQFITTWQEYLETKKLQRANRLIISSIRKSAKRLLNKHCKSVVSNESDIKLLLAYSTAIKILKFYESELITITNMLIEYEAYLAHGNFLDSWLFYKQRPLSELWDHRG